MKGSSLNATMAVLTTTSTIGSFSTLHTFTKVSAKLVNPGFRFSNFAVQSQKGSNSQSEGRGRRVWRRKKLTKKDDDTKYRLEEVPFLLEEHVRRIEEDGSLLAMDIDRLLLSEENRFAFVNEIAAEAKEYVENNRDEYGSKKAILHVISNRMNEAGFDRPEAYIEPDPFKPGPSFLRDDL